MTSRKPKQVNQILCERGVTYVDCVYVSAMYRYRWWWIHINPRILLPALRRDHRKIIIANGKRRGWGEIRSGWIPLSRYDISGKGLRFSIVRFVRKYLGLGLKKYERGYIYIGIGHFRYVVTQRVSKEGLYICEVYDKRTEDQIGTFVFNQDFSEVYPRTNRDGVINTLHVIIGYVADSLVYSRAAGMLSKTIKVSV